MTGDFFLGFKKDGLTILLNLRLLGFIKNKYKSAKKIKNDLPLCSDNHMKSLCVFYYHKFIF